MRVAPAIHLSTEARSQLHTLVRRRTTPVRVTERCRIVLLAADGLQDKQIAERMGVTPLMASRWRRRCARIAEGYAATGPHADDHCRTGCRNRRTHHAEHSWISSEVGLIHLFFLEQQQNAVTAACFPDIPP